MDASKVIALWDRECKTNTEKSGACVLWTGRGFGEEGYGLLKGPDVAILAHRAAYLKGKKILPEVRIEHMCGHKRCVAIEHLHLMD